MVLYGNIYELVDKMAVEGTTMSKKIGGIYESSNC